MTLQITQVHDAAYLSDGRVLFRCDCGDITDVYCEILPGHRNAPNNKRLQRWLAINTPTDYVEPTAVPPHNERREERREVFSRTLDRLNPVWHSEPNNSTTVSSSHACLHVARADCCAVVNSPCQTGFNR